MALILLSLTAAFASALAEVEMQFTRWPQSLTAPIGVDVTFECAVNVPGERLVWRRKPIHTEEDWRELQGTGDGGKGISTSLTVRIKEDTQSSYYQCVVWYGAISLASVPGRLTVARLQVHQQIQQRSVSAPLHNTVVLHCRPPLSEPPAIITWWKEENRGTRTHHSSPHGVLVLPNVTTEDSGMYGCSAANELSAQTLDLPDRIYLRVQHEPRGSPRLLESDDYVGVLDNQGVLTQAVRANEALRLWCGAVGVPVPHVTWSHQHGVLPPRARVDNGHLTVPSMRHDYEGVYTCEAGEVRREWRVSVLQAPRFEGSAQAVNATEDGRAHVKCGIPRGSPAPTMHWLLNGQPLRTHGGIRIHGSDLHIEHLEKRHAGIVQCFACNELGCAYDAILLTVVPMQITDQVYYGEAERPAHLQTQSPKNNSKKSSRKHKPDMVPPSRPNVTRMSDESVMVSWTASSQGLPIQFFKVQYREATNSSSVQWQTCNQDIPAYIHSYEVDGLIPDRYYKFRIAAVYLNQDNKSGRSSARFYLQHGGFRAPRAPVLTRALALSATRIEINWTWSSGPGGVQADGFYLYYRAVSSAGEYEKATATGGTAARSTQLAHLAPDTAYEFKLQAYTAQAPSEFSIIKVAKTLKAPSPQPSTSTEAAGAGDVGGVADSGGGMLVTAGGALGAAALLIGSVLTLLLCRRARRAAPSKEKASRPPSVGGNGYIPAKVPITITANPMLAEGGDSGVEMSYMHNNNCGTTNDDPASVKNGPAPRSYV